MINGTPALTVTTSSYPGRPGSYIYYFGAAAAGNWVYFAVTFQIVAPLTSALARVNVITGAYEHVCQLSESNAGYWSLATSADGTKLYAVNSASQNLVTVDLATGTPSAAVSFSGMGQPFTAAPYLDGKHVIGGLNGAKIADFEARTLTNFAPIPTSGCGCGLQVCSPSLGTTIWMVARGAGYGTPSLFAVSPAGKPDFLRFIGGTLEDAATEIPASGPFTLDYLTYRLNGGIMACDADYLYVIYRSSNPRKLLRINIATGQATYAADLGNMNVVGAIVTAGRLCVVTEGTVATFT